MERYKHWRDVPAAAWPWPHFTAREMAATDTGEVAFEPEFMHRLEAARVIYGRAMRVTSATRTPARNADVGGVKDSEHEIGWGVDIACEASRDRHDLLKALLAAGFTRIGIYATHLHVGADPARDACVIWFGSKD